jgi:UDP-N-acetylglucosamine 2-epimerase (non-hydrolysing)
VTPSLIPSTCTLIRTSTARNITYWVGTDTERIVAETFRLLDAPEAHAATARPVNPYGNGHAAERIVKALMEWCEDEG